MRFLNLYWRTLKDRKLSWPTIWVSVISYVLLIIGIYPTFANIPGFQKLLESYPKGLLAILAGSSGVNMFTPAGFISIEFLQLWGMIIIAGFVISTSTAIVAKEVDGHTMDLILTQPIDRVEYLTARLAADTTMILGLVVSTTGAMWLGTKMVEFPLKTGGIIAVGALLMAVYIMIECFSLLMGTMMERGRAVIVAVGFLIGSHLLNGLGQISTMLDGYRWLSFFYYYNPADALASGQTPWAPILLFLGLALIFFTGAVVMFREKDIPA